MKVRTKAFLQVIGAIAVMTAVASLLNYLSPKYGMIIYFAGVAIWMTYCLVMAQTSMLESKQNRIIDELKK